jgi:hypothetical protein
VIQITLKFSDGEPKTYGNTVVAFARYLFRLGFAMLSINTSQPVNWPSPPSTSVAPVQPSPAVGGVQAMSRDGQTDSGRHRHGGSQGRLGDGRSAPESGTSGSGGLQAAPLLPREKSDIDLSSPAGQAIDAQLRTEQRRDEEQKAREKAEQKLQLQEVLATVWKASAAVVDVVLRRESALAESDVSALANDASPGAVDRGVASVVETATAMDPAVVLRREQEPVAYTEQGARSWATLEAGSLLSRRI